MFIFRTVAFYPKALSQNMSTYIPSCPSLHSKDSCGRLWNYCSPTSLSSYRGASWSGSYSLILLTPIAYRSCSAPFHQSPLIHTCTHIHHISTVYCTISLDDKIANVTKSSRRPDCQVCADGCAQAVAGQEPCSQQDASKIALRYVLAVFALPLID